MGQVFTFLHFSDIHFNSWTKPEYDLDMELRNEMELDIKKIVEQEKLEVYGIIICGDVAFSGQAYEYELAQQFLNQLISKLKINEEHIFCVPGNHDVDQKVPKQSISLYALQKLLERSEKTDLGTYLSMVSEDRKTKSDDLLYEPLKEYNNFAGKYMGDFSSRKPNWRHEIENFDQKYKFVIYGLNSTMISNADDHNNNGQIRKMVIGRHQLPERHLNEVIMTVCHHPPEDWKDDMSTVLDRRVAIQLFGHRHEQVIDENAYRIKIGTGALQPSRKEGGWEPRYNFLSIQIIGDELNLVIYPRRWNDELGEFEADLDECPTGQVFTRIILPLDFKQELNADIIAESDIVVRNTPEEVRKFVCHFWTLNNEKRHELLKKFKEYDEFDLTDLAGQIDEIIKIAEKNNILHRMIEELEKA